MNETKNQDSRKEFFPEAYVKRAVKILRLLSDENRLRIMLYLAKEGPTYVTKMGQALELNQTTLSHHLSLLRNADLIVPIREGKNIYYEINRPLWREMGLQFFLHLGKGPNVKFLDRFVISMLR
ncbi:MAG: ArsR family transcriptional regulator [Calditrichaeota bacterium]|nr:MAG: ArsR family transcriptional regulator [Calditrichota bacterium]